MKSKLIRNHFYLFTFNPDKLELREDGCFLKKDFEGKVKFIPVLPEKGTFPVEGEFNRLGAGCVVVGCMYFRYQNDGEIENLEVQVNEVDINDEDLTYALEGFIQYEKGMWEIEVKAAPHKDFHFYFRREVGAGKWEFGGKI